MLESNDSEWRSLEDAVIQVLASARIKGIGQEVIAGE